jgi:ABC-2 type transport system ATP-binding protein
MDVTDAPPLEALGLGKRFGSHDALQGVDLRIEPGEAVGLLGPNGAGKSTFVKLACGLARPTTGTVRVFGRAPTDAAARARIGYLAELFRFPAQLRPDELLRDHQRLTGSTGGSAERDRVLGMVGLDDSATRARRLGNFSKGMQQRLGIAQALIGDPDLLLLDEPTSALDPSSRKDVRTIIESLRERGASVLVNSHLLGEVERTCDRVVIVRRGEVVARGKMSELEAGTHDVVVETDDGEQVLTNASRDQVAERVAQLVADGRRIYRVQQTGGALEQASLDAVGEDRG